eukprot:403351015
MSDSSAFFMVAGFFLLKVGTIRKKNTSHIILLNLMSACLTLLLWWLTGYGFAFGENKNHFISGDERAFASNKFTKNGVMSYLFVFHFALCTVTTSIVSGSLVERVNVHVFFGYCCFLAGFVYPAVAAWVWSPGGWLNERGFHDLAGTSVVHITGGFGGMIGAIVVGPRLLKQKRVHNIDREQLCQEKDYISILKTIDSEEDRIIFRKWFLLQLDEEIRPSNETYMALGTTILFTAWIIYNSDNVIHSFLYDYYSDYDLDNPYKAMINTLLSGSVGGICTLYLKPLILRSSHPTTKFDIRNLCNGILVGCIAVTGISDNSENWAAVIIGFFAALFYILGVYVSKKFRIDDPVDSFSVHGFGGICGTIAVAFFDNDSGIIFKNEKKGEYLGTQLIGLIVITGWTSVMSLIYFLPFRLCKIVRVSDSVELMGFDIAQMGSLSKKQMRKIRQEVMLSESEIQGRADDKLQESEKNLKAENDSRFSTNQVHPSNLAFERESQEVNGNHVNILPQRDGPRNNSHI